VISQDSDAETSGYLYFVLMASSMRHRRATVWFVESWKHPHTSISSTTPQIHQKLQQQRMPLQLYADCCIHVDPRKLVRPLSTCIHVPPFGRGHLSQSSLTCRMVRAIGQQFLFLKPLKFSWMTTGFPACRFGTGDLLPLASYSPYSLCDTFSGIDRYTLLGNTPKLVPYL